MSNELHFDRSPLTEAVIEIRVQMPSGVSLENLAALQAGQENDYPTRRDRLFVEGQFSTDPQVPPAVGNRLHVGYDFVSADERQIVQVRLDAFAFSRLWPYENWTTFRDEARRWWDIYQKITKPTAITRIAVRYINRIDLPELRVDLKEYLRTGPEISPTLPQGLSAYFMQLQIPLANLNALLSLNQALVMPEMANGLSASIILDIDLSRQGNVPQSDEEVWEYLEQLRNQKNEVFLGCITETTERLLGRTK